jgi:hypothetical protein
MFKKFFEVTGSTTNRSPNRNSTYLKGAHLTNVLVGVDEPPAEKSAYFIAAEYVPAVCLFLLGHAQTVRVRIIGEDVNGADAVRRLERQIQGAGPLFRVGKINGGELRVRILLLFHTH